MAKATITTNFASIIIITVHNTMKTKNQPNINIKNILALQKIAKTKKLLPQPSPEIKTTFTTINIFKNTKR